MTLALDVKKPVGSEALTVSSPTPMDLLQIAVSQNLDVDKLQKLMELQLTWEKNEARKAFVEAMNRFKSNPPQIIKNKHVKFGQTEYDHATLDHVCKAAMEGLSKVGISHRWHVTQGDSLIKVTCVLTHEQGHSEETTLQGPTDTSGSKNAIQAIGSTVTYLQRYTLLAATGLAAGNDDDGNSAGPATSDQSKQIPDERYVELRDGIENAGNQQELEKLYKVACDEARSIGDSASLKDFQKAKNKAYTRLHNASR